MSINDRKQPVIRKNKKISKYILNNNNKINFNKKLIPLSEKISKLSDKNYIKYIEYLQILFKELSSKITRKNFVKRINYKEYRDNDILYLFNIFFQSRADNIKRKTLNLNLFNYINSTFDIDTIIMLDKLLVNMNSCIDNNHYIQNNEDSVYDKIKFNECLTLFDINESNKVSFQKIKNNYNLKIEFAGGNTILKNKFNKAFILLREQYENYLKSFDSSIPNNYEIVKAINDDVIKENYFKETTD